MFGVTASSTPTSTRTSQQHRRHGVGHRPATNAVIATIPVGYCTAAAVSPVCAGAYVSASAGLLVIDTHTDTITGTIPLGTAGVAVSPDGTAPTQRRGGGQQRGHSVVIDTATNTVTSTVPVGDSAGNGPGCVAVSPDGTASTSPPNDATMSVIHTSATPSAPPSPCPSEPHRGAVSPDGSRAYVPVDGDGTVSRAIDTATNAVTTTINVGRGFVLGLGVGPHAPASTSPSPTPSPTPNSTAPYRRSTPRPAP